MTVLGTYSVTLEVPNVKDGIKFYGDAGFEVRTDGETGYCRCPGQERDTITLLGGAERKKLHHIALRADPALFGLAQKKVGELGGEIIKVPDGFNDAGLWLRDLHGMTVHLIDVPADPPIATTGPYSINEPGRTPRIRKSAMLARAETKAAVPLRLGHILVFSPNPLKSAEFFSEALGMGLADRSQDIIAFMCARKNSDHHLLAFARSPSIGFHHASFQVANPDEVGRGGSALVEKSSNGNWGFGRHTIGSNFFYYVQDPWGSWLEYFADMDFIDDYELWTPTNYALEDSLHNWGPAVPADFVHNYEADEQPFVGKSAA